MQDSHSPQTELKIHHIIVLVALFASLFGTLLFLEIINHNATHITGTASLEIEQEKTTQENYVLTTVRVTGENETEENLHK